MLRTSLAVAVFLFAASSRAQDAPPPLVPADAELAIGLDARTLYGDATFDALMDLVEASASYQAHAGQLAAWGFDPRADVHEVVFAVDRLGATGAEFVVVVTGDLSVDEMEARMATQPGLRREASADGTIWRDARGTSYALTEHVAVAGVGSMFEQARGAVLQGASVATTGGTATVWMRLSTTEELRGRHPALGTLIGLEASVEVDATPAFHIAARMTDADSATAGMREIRHALDTAAQVPEVEALGIAPLVHRAVVAIRGTTVTFDSEIDAASWNQFSAKLSDLVAEELR